MNITELFLGLYHNSLPECHITPVTVIHSISMTLKSE